MSLGRESWSSGYGKRLTIQRKYSIILGQFWLLLMAKYRTNNLAIWSPCCWCLADTGFYCCVSHFLFIFFWLFSFLQFRFLRFCHHLTKEKDSLKCRPKMLLLLSVTIFGKISPLRENFKNIWQLFDGLICICQTFETTLENSVYFWANLCSCKWPNFEQTFHTSGHTAAAQNVSGNRKM